MIKILAADDDQGMLEFYKALFSEAGFEVATAPDGAAAMESETRGGAGGVSLRVELR